uniref:PPM-type phosphatase domain-containing protein n=1 Tax=Corethrella appendiculata TaxID=1370023 RepID=U5EZ54_9DIPT
MPSLRQRVTTYFRQLSFIAESRDERNVNYHSIETDGSFITKYLESCTKNVETDSNKPQILFGKDPNDLPDYKLKPYNTGSTTITTACTGPEEGLNGVIRPKVHLSAGPDIDFIDIQDQDIENNEYTSTSTGSCSKTHISKYKSTYKQNVKQSNESGSKYFSKNELTSKKNCDNVPNVRKSSIKDVNINQIVSPNFDSIPSVNCWNQLIDNNAYGLSISLYEENILTNERLGNPIADCYGLISRGDVVVMALADGVNWGEGARIAARSAVQGSLEYIDNAVFGSGQGRMATTTKEVFVSLLRSFWEAHSCILEVGGALSTLTVAIILPLRSNEENKYVVCSCNVGDSLGYIYSKQHGVREFTEGSHDINHRDMRDALGALGPANGDKPELSNLTLSISIVESGDVVFLTSDGISDNFDPVVGKFAEALFNELQITNPVKEPSKHSSKNNYLKKPENSKNIHTVNTYSSNNRYNKPSTSSSSVAKSTKPASVKNDATRPKYSRSQTCIMESRRKQTNKLVPSSNIPISAAGLPLVTGAQRHALTLLRLSDLLCYGINGTIKPVIDAKNVCNLLIDFARMVTSAKRKYLEQRELFYRITTDIDGNKKEVELSKTQQRSARKKTIESSTFMNLPGKLDHATVVAFVVGSGKKQYNETNL